MLPRRRTARLAPALLVALSALPAAVHGAQPKAESGLDARIDQEADRVAPQLVELRHRIHQNPELSNREAQTAELVAAHLRALGLEARTGIAKTGVVALLQGGKPGPLIAVRADMDALPVDRGDRPPVRAPPRRTPSWARRSAWPTPAATTSTPRRCSASPSVLAALKADLAGSVLFIFQPAEEGPPAGRERRRRADARRRASSPDQAAGRLRPALLPRPRRRPGRLNPGPTMAAVDQFRIKIKGKQAHGAYPNLASIRSSSAAEAIMALADHPLAQPRRRSSRACSRSASSAAASASTSSPARSTSRARCAPTTRRCATRSSGGCGRSSTASPGPNGGAFEMEYQQQRAGHGQRPGAHRRVQPLLERIAGRRQRQARGAHDGAARTSPTSPNEVPGFFFRLGVVKPGTTSGGLHTPTFRADDSAVPAGIRVMSRLLVDYLFLDIETLRTLPR